jgi:hypothetical protein
MSTIVTVSFAVAVLIVMLLEIPEGSRNLAYLLLGTLATSFGAVLNFWVGTSQSSKEKTEILNAYVLAAKTDQTKRGG